jgi:hypothetical protein
LSKKAVYFTVIASICGGTLIGPAVARAAHPTPNTPVQEIGLDAELIFRESINLLPEKSSYSFKKSGGLDSETNIGCYLTFKSNSVDRTIEAGKSFYTTSYKDDSDDRAIRVHIHLDQYKQRLSMTCSGLKSETKKHITLKEVNEALGGIAELVPASPLPFDYQDQLEEQSRTWKGEGFNQNQYVKDPYTGMVNYYSFHESHFTSLFRSPIKKLLSAVTQNPKNDNWSVESRDSIYVFDRTYNDILFRKLMASYNVLTPKEEFRGNFEKRLRHYDIDLNFGDLSTAHETNMVETYVRSLINHLKTAGKVEEVISVSLWTDGKNTYFNVQLIANEWLPKRAALK